MAPSPRPKQPPSPRRVLTAGQHPNFFMGMSVQIARRYLFLDIQKKLMAYLCIITALSLFAMLAGFSIHGGSAYFLQKHNIFNQYGVKLGWFWTCAIVGPFIWYSSKMHHKESDRVIIDFLRLAVATAMWYFTVGLFHRVHEMTSRCDKSLRWNRTQCSENGAAWIPGMDISGHCFLMLYSIAIISEEASSFREWSQLKSGESDTQRKQFQLNATIVQLSFIAMFLLHLFWDVQLVISVLYYHTFIDKILGALSALVCWSLTYRFLYPSGLLASPILRKKAPVV